MLCKLKWRFSVENPQFFPLTYFVDFCPESPLLTIFPILISKKTPQAVSTFPTAHGVFIFTGSEAVLKKSPSPDTWPHTCRSSYTSRSR